MRLSDARMQAVAADDVVEALADVATGRPVRGIVELGGQEALPIAELGRRWLRNRNDQREVVTDLGHIALADWLTTPAAQR